MARKSRTSGENAGDVCRTTSPFEASYPNIARWISQEGGWIELGADHYSRSLARALYGGGMVWEGTATYESLDEALRAMEQGIAVWLEANRPEGWSGGKAGPAGSRSARRRTDRKGPSKARSRVPKGQLIPTSTHADDDRRIKESVATRPGRAIVVKVRKLSDIAEALRRGEDFPITRLTSLKGLCNDPDSAHSFALFLVGQVREAAAVEDETGRVGALIERAETQMKSYLDAPTEGRKHKLDSLLSEIEAEQDEYRRIRWGTVRIVRSRNLLVAEKALKSILRSDEAPSWLYHAARDYAERYDSRYGTGLIPSSAPMMARIADFWRDYFGLEP